MSSEMVVTALATTISETFADNNFTWKIGGSAKVPTPDDVQAVLNKAKYEVEYQAVNSHLKNTSPQISMRHLLFKQNDVGNVEVFVLMGEIE